MAAIPSSPAGLHTAEEAARALAVNPAPGRSRGERGRRSAPAATPASGDWARQTALAADFGDTEEEVWGQNAPQAERGFFGEKTRCFPKARPLGVLRCLDLEQCLVARTAPAFVMMLLQYFLEKWLL